MLETTDNLREIRSQLIAEGVDALKAQMAAGWIAGGMGREQALRIATDSMLD